MRLRQRVIGTAARPRMAICVTNKHMYVQFIDDDAGNTLASATTLKDKKPCNQETAKWVGEQAAAAAKAKGIVMVVVDRGGFQYHGRVKALVEAAVAAGLKISEKPPKPPKEHKKADTDKKADKAEKAAKKPAEKADKKPAAKPAAKKEAK